MGSVGRALAERDENALMREIRSGGGGCGGARERAKVRDDRRRAAGGRRCDARAERWMVRTIHFEPSWHPATDGNAHCTAAEMKHFASKKTLLVLSTALIALTAAYKIEEPAARGETLEYDDAEDSSVSLRYRNDDYAAFSEIIDMLLFDEDPDPYADEGARYVNQM